MVLFKCIHIWLTGAFNTGELWLLGVFISKELRLPCSEYTTGESIRISLQKLAGAEKYSRESRLPCDEFSRESWLLGEFRTGKFLDMNSRLPSVFINGQLL
jgi:hypothetical protein